MTLLGHSCYSFGDEPIRYLKCSGNTVKWQNIRKTTVSFLKAREMKKEGLIELIRLIIKPPLGTT